MRLIVFEITLALVVISVASTSRAQNFDAAANNENAQDVDAQKEALKRPERLTVIAPKYLRPQSDYHALITLENSIATAQVDVQLTGARDSNREQSEAKSILVSSGETQTVKFTIGDWQPAEYILNVTAQAVDRSWSWTQEAPLVYQAKSFSAFIQTDKAIYKPGQLVQFRMLFLTQTLTPLILKDEINVTLADPSKNLIKQWTYLSNYRGLLSLEQQLSDDPMLGDYTITVEARNQQVSKKFQVAEYILPTFDVNVRLPTYVTYKESDFTATVVATYTYGKPVNGHVAMTVQPLVRFSNLDTRPLQQAQYRARLVNGTADISLNLVKDLKLSPELFEREIEFFALVEEDLTGRKYNKTKTIKIHDKNHKFELLNAKERFKPGLSHSVQVKVAYQDDTPVENDGPQVELVAMVAGDRVLEAVKLQPVNGLIEHTLSIPRKVPYPGSDEPLLPTVLRLRANYRGHTHYLPNVESMFSESEQFMKISLPQLQNQIGRNRKQRNSVHVDDELKVQVQTTEPIEQFTCQGVAKGDIIWALSPNAKNKTNYEFEVKVDQRMAPEGKILCFYVRPKNKEIIADSIRVPVIGLIRNVIKLQTSREEAKPGQEVEVGVLTHANSLVGLLGIDQSVLLLKSGNDITYKDVADDMKSYGSGKATGRFSDFATSANGLIDEADMILLTNNKVFSGPGYRYGTSVMYSASVFVRKDPTLKRSGISLNSLLLGDTLQPPDYHLDKRNKDPLVIRSSFPETWLWENATAGADGSARFKSKIPDTITSWVLSAFSLNENQGLALTQSPTKVRVFRPFFIKLNLPHSIIRGETVNLQAIIFNYSERPTRARVTLDNRNGEFEFVEAANNIEDEQYMGNKSESKLVSVPAEDGTSVSFLIKPLKLGKIDIRVIAEGEFARDGVVRKLLVKPEGQTQHLNKAFLIQLDGPQSVWTRNFTIDVPVNAVPDSSKVFVSAVGDIMGPGLSNVDDLLRLPYGCGEQNMVNLVPNIVIFNYLQKTNRLKDIQRTRAIRNVESGYQRQLKYKRLDGSFSAFGQDDKNGSVWLTAYVLKTLQQAKSVISTVDESVVRQAANYLARFARSDGSIEESGMLHHKDLQSHAASGASTYLTAYSLIALMQRKVAPDGEAPAPVALNEVIEKGLDYLESQLDVVASKESPYELAIITYALHLASRKPDLMDRAYEKLWTRAQEHDDTVWWADTSRAWDKDHAESSAKLRGGNTTLERESSALDFDFATSSTTSTSTVQPPLKPIPKNTKHSAHLFVPDSLTIEMTSFALLTAVKRGDLDRALPIVKWLIQKQNSNGGFASTQDTVLAIEALASFAEASSDPMRSLSIDLEFLYPHQSGAGFRRNNVDEMLISRQNALINQQTRLPDNITWVQVKANGAGSAVVQVAWQYNLLVSAEKPAFYLNPILDKNSNANYIQLSVCTFYKMGEASNMAVVEVELPSGYVADVEALPGLKRFKSIKRIDTSDSDTKVHVYLDKVTRDEICFTIPAHRTSKVSNNRPVPVTIYDYYDRQQTARIFYEPPAASSCDICDSSACQEMCSRKPQKSERLRSLHEQRHVVPVTNTTAFQPPDRSAKLRQGNGWNGTLPDAAKLLPLTKVFNSLVTAAKNLDSQ